MNRNMITRKMNPMKNRAIINPGASDAMSFTGSSMVMGIPAAAGGSPAC
jgi:hypothetical protein